VQEIENELEKANQENAELQEALAAKSAALNDKD
jgi:hypothetical protein